MFVRLFVFLGDSSKRSRNTLDSKHELQRTVQNSLRL